MVERWVLSRRRWALAFECSKIQNLKLSVWSDTWAELIESLKESVWVANLI